MLLMNRKLFLLYFLSLLWSISNAQVWSKEDSVKLQNTLTDGREIIINEDFRRSIENGIFKTPTLINEKKFDLMKNISDIGKPDSVRLRYIDPYSVPPAVLMLYVLYIDQLDSVFNNSSVLLSAANRKAIMKAVPGLFINYSSDGFSYVGAGITVDYNHIFSMLLSPAYRRRYNNSKNATAYKSYDNGGGVKFEIPESERKKMRQTINTIKVTGSKTNPIDD